MQILGGFNLSHLLAFFAPLFTSFFTTLRTPFLQPIVEAVLLCIFALFMLFDVFFQ